MFLPSRIKNFILVSLIFSFSLSFGQSPYFHHLEVLKNKKNLKTYCIFQDSKSYLWFSTSEGLFSFDGIEAKFYGEADSLHKSWVTAIAEDQLGQIWFGHKDGMIEVFNGRYFEDFEPEEGLPIEKISFIFFDKSDMLWFGTEGEGVYYYTGKNRKRLYNLNEDDGLNDNYAYCMVQDQNGELYVGTDNGIALLDTVERKIQDVISMKDGLPDNIVRDLEVRGNELWIAMDEMGVSTYNVDKKEFSQLPEWPFGRINNFVINQIGECWISTRHDGIVRVVKAEDNMFLFKQFVSDHGLKGTSTQYIYKDREENIWIGERGALTYTTSSPFEFLDGREGFEKGNAFSFIEDRQGRYWAATEEGLFRIQRNELGDLDIKQFKPSGMESQGSFISLFEDSEGFIWAGTYGYGACRLHPESMEFIHFNEKNGLPDNNVVNICQHKDKVWFSTLGGGAASYAIQEKHFESFSQNDQMKSNFVYFTYVDRADRIWFATDGGGLIRFDGDETKNILPDSLGIKTVYSLVEDLRGDIWFSSAEKGLLRFDGKQFHYVEENKEYQIRDLRGMAADTLGNIFLFGNEYFQIFSCETKHFETFGNESGVSFLEPNLNAVSQDNKGNIWVSTHHGMVHYKSQLVNRYQFEPSVYLNEKLLFFEPIPEGMDQFSYKQNHLSFGFVGFWFQAPEKLLYRYKLDGYDIDWSRPSTSRSVTYSNLPPGEYWFIVQTSQKLGVWDEASSQSFHFYINPPFYTTWWFILSCILVFLFSVYVFIKSRTAKLRRDKELLEDEVKKRTMTISQQKEELETQHEYVVKQRDQIARQNEDIKASIKYASRIQEAILPNKQDLEEHLGDHFLLFRPMDIVSGDYYWSKEIADKIYFVAADCTGHGVPGAFMSVLGISLLNKITESSHKREADEILNLLREEVKRALNQSGKAHEQKDGMDLSLIIYDKESKQIDFAGAYNSAYVIRNNEFIELQADRMPIGVYIRELPFKMQRFQLEKEDRLYMFSDGYYDQIGGPKGRKYKRKPFRELLMEIHQLPMEEQRQRLDSEIEEWLQGNHQNDDIVVVGIRVE